MHMRREHRESKRLAEEKTGLQALFLYTKGRVGGRGRGGEREGLQSCSGQLLPGDEEFMLDLSLFSARLQ